MKVLGQVIMAKNGNISETRKNSIWTIKKKNIDLSGHIVAVDTFRIWKEDNKWYIIQGYNKAIMLPKEVIDIIIKEETKDKLRSEE
jgi:hypothetical protein